jgi:hypothetical protein
MICESSQIIGGSKGCVPLGRRALAREGRQGALATIGRGKSEISPSKASVWESSG